MEETVASLSLAVHEKLELKKNRLTPLPGKDSGKRICVVTGVHGDELEGQYVAVLRYLSRVGLLRYNCHSGYLSSVVQETEMANVLTPAGGIFRRFVEPGQEMEYGQKLGVILDPFTAEIEAEILCPTSGVVFFALKKPLTTEHEVAFKVIRRLHGGCL